MAEAFFFGRKGPLAYLPNARADVLPGMNAAVSRFLTRAPGVFFHRPRRNSARDGEEHLDTTRGRSITFSPSLLVGAGTRYCVRVRPSKFINRGGSPQQRLLPIGEHVAQNGRGANNIRSSHYFAAYFRRRAICHPATSSRRPYLDLPYSRPTTTPLERVLPTSFSAACCCHFAALHFFLGCFAAAFLPIFSCHRILISSLSFSYFGFVSIYTFTFWFVLAAYCIFALHDDPHSYRQHGKGVTP